ncbi:MAG: tetratricopeptide repeat protein [Bacteroidetes bacterium]|nr:tetratricopeptide repeat protein [Bacteroidota bacterium]
MLINKVEADFILKCADSGLLLAKKVKYTLGEIKIYTALGILYKDLENISKSLQYHEKALQLSLLLNHKKSIGNSYLNIAVMYKLMANYTEAAKYYFSALKVYEEVKDTAGMATNYFNLGSLFQVQDKLNEAIDYYSKAKFYFSKINYTEGVANVYSNMGIIYRDMEKYDSAYFALSQSNELYLKSTTNRSGYLSNSRTLSLVLKDMGLRKLEANNKIEAENHFAEAEKLLLTSINSFPVDGIKNSLIAADWVNLGYLYTVQKRYAESRERLNEALELLKKLDNKIHLPSTYKNLSILDSTMAADTSFSTTTRLFHAEQSLTFLKLSYKAQKELLNEENKKQIEELKIRYETEKKDNEILLLNKENAFKDISLKEQLSALLISKLRDEKNKNEIELLSSSNAISELRLTSTQQELEKQLLKSKAEAYELQLSKQERDLKNNELGEEKLLRGVTTGGSLALLIIGFLVFNRLKLRKQLEQKEAILRQRKAISADLHDDVGSTLSSISIYSEAIKNKLTHNETEKVMDLVNKIGENARETISNLSDIVWSINPINDSGEVIFNRMETFAYSLFSSKGIKLNFTSDKSLHSINYSIEMKQNMFLIFKEAINNCAKYSQATLVDVDIRKNNNLMNITISDNGIGFDPTSTNGGNGLRNMKERASELNGAIDIQSMDKGTRISLSLPLAS